MGNPNHETQTRSIALPELMPDGRDALNLVEFPLALLSDRSSKDQKTISFKDMVWDKGQRKQVFRRLTITASDQYGLPTALDDEVILGLLQLSKQDAFEHRRVPFTRYDLLRILGWRDEGKSYKRLETSLKRWLGVTLYYERAWWDPGHKIWADKHFHLLDNLLLYRRQSKCQPEDVSSYFTWNQEVFDSFQSGSLKQVDMDLYRSLSLPTSKRLFRFLDKRFYFAQTLTFDLKTFALEHIGLSRSYDCSQIKRRLKPAITELWKSGFLAAIDESDTFRRIRPGQWEILFVRGSQKATKSTSRTSPQGEALIARGVSASMAKRLVREHQAKHIDEKVQVFDRLRKDNDKRISRNPSGYLVRSIIDDYVTPKKKSVKLQTTAESSPQASIVNSRIQNAKEKRVDAYINRLNDADRLKMEEEAISCASSLQLKGLRRAESKSRQGRIVEYRRSIVISHVRKLLKTGPSQKNVTKDFIPCYSLDCRTAFCFSIRTPSLAVVLQSTHPRQ
jgi:hypothetical protein